MSLPENFGIEQFLDFLTVQKRYAAHTVISYRNDLEAFFTFVVDEFEQESLTCISPSIVRSWLASLKEQKLASKTVNRKISTLKSFFKHQLRKGVIKSSPVSAITSLKTGRKLPVYLEEKDAGKLFSGTAFPDDYEGRMHYLILELFYQCGIRLSELITLREDCFSTAMGTIKVLGKGNKQRLVPVSNELSRHLREYISEKRKVFENVSHPFLLANTNGNPLYPKYVYNVVHKYLGQVSTLVKRSPHVLRHTFATHLTNNGADINAIKELLGHSSLAATQIYTHNTIEKLKEVHKLAHPKA